ncbi:MAG TPA: Eco57I restriction-modification methylase domain-containing protein [Mycobacteriales bacterium]|nr:Eco57I restriction-modification methylase domain-containing protein [Mycobacteriales bacterium]
MTAAALPEPAPPVLARPLGARGSRADVGGPDPTGEPGAAAAAVLAAVPGWWHARARAVGLTGRWLEVTQALDAVPPPGVLAGGPGTRPVVGASGHELGAAYLTALTPQVRARHGRHYTPPLLAEHLWHMVRRSLGWACPARPLPGLVRDPACGAGALLLPALREQLAAHAGADPEAVLAGLPRLVEGVDADPAAVWLANIVLAAEALPLLAATPARRRRPLPALARAGDGLAPAQAAVRVVVMNPPYGRVRLSAEDRDRFAPVLFGHANLYSLFLAAALDCLDDQGVVAALVPTSFTSGRYFANLRAVLAAEAPLREVSFVGDRDGVFAGVLQETCLATFSRRRSPRTAVTCVNRQLSDVATVERPAGDRPWLLPRRREDAPVAAAAAAMPLTLATAGWKVSTGPLVWNRRRADLSGRPGGGRVPVLWAADMDGGRLHRDPARDALRYLRLRDPADRTVMTLGEPAVLVQRTTAPEQARRLVAIELTPEGLAEWGGAVVVENHVNVLRPTRPDPLLSRATLARVLATGTMDRLMRCVSGSVAVSAYELGSLPFPAPSVLRCWGHLHGPALDAAVATAYQPAIR